MDLQCARAALCGSVFSLLLSCCTHAHDLQRLNALRPRPSSEAKTDRTGGTGTDRAGRFRWSLIATRLVPRTPRHRRVGACQRPERGGHATRRGRSAPARPCPGRDTSAVAGLQDWPPAGGLCRSGLRSISRRIAHCYWSAPGHSCMNALACTDIWMGRLTRQAATGPSETFATSQRYAPVLFTRAGHRRFATGLCYLSIYPAADAQSPKATNHT